VRIRRAVIAALVVASIVVCLGCAPPSPSIDVSSWHAEKLPGVIVSMPGLNENAKGDVMKQWRIVVMTNRWLLQISVPLNAYNQLFVHERVTVFAIVSKDGKQIQVVFLQTTPFHLPGAEKRSDS
jgi:hypothetical protein